MKNMSDFKGTKGEFKINLDDPAKVVMYEKESSKRIALLYNEEKYVYLPKGQAEANARLFANSKNVLEAAIEAHEFVCMSLAFEAGRTTSDADKISEFIKEHPFRIKLEQAISDSL